MPNKRLDTSDKNIADVMAVDAVAAFDRALSGARELEGIDRAQVILASDLIYEGLAFLREAIEDAK